MKRPNIVLVIADDVTPAYHGCYGGPTPTPHIDRLAREGARFTQAHAVVPLCNPSRYSIFTGQIPGRASSASAHCTTAEPYSIAQNADLQPDTPTIAKLLRQAGYFTGHVGKWHSNFAFAGNQEWSAELGSDANLDDPAIDTLLRNRQDVHREVVRQCAGFEWVEAVNWGNLMGDRPSRLRKHNPAWMTDAALRFLDEAKNDERPFYLHLANTVPHSPDPHKSLGADHRYTFAGKLEEPPASHPDDASVLERLKAAGLQTDGPIAGVNAGMVQVDDQIGALIKKLESIGELDNTLFIYTADHGIHGKGTCYIGGYHMPLVMRFPEMIKSGTVIEAPVSHVDFLPTICEAAGAGLPTGHTLDGKSYLPVLKGDAVSTREFTYQEMGVSRAVTHGRWRYIEFHYPDSVIERMKSGDLDMPPSFEAYVEGPFCDYNFINKPCYFDPRQLYNLDADPFERRNLIHDPACQDIASTLAEQLHSITDTLPGPYRHDTPEFMRSAQYLRLVEKRRLAVSQKSFYPQGFDQEKIFNLNLTDPLAEA